MFKYYFSKLLLKIQLPAIKNSEINRSSKVASKATVYDSVIDKYSYVGVNSYIINTEVGAFCSIGNDCSIGLGRHPYEYVAMSPLFYSEHNIFKRCFAQNNFKEYERTVIENDVWIGERALIKDGLHIGTGAVIGAGTVVTHDVPPYAIVVGNPGRIIKYRFDDRIIQSLLESEWWNLTEEELTEIGKAVDDVNLFLKLIKEVRK